MHNIHLIDCLCFHSNHHYAKFLNKSSLLINAVKEQQQQKNLKMLIESEWKKKKKVSMV